MCLAVPGQVVAVDGRTAVVLFGGVERDVLLDLVPDVACGDWVLVHAGFAIQKMTEEQASETLDLLRAMGDVADGPTGVPT